MAEFVLMPQKGLTEESAILSAWHVKKGDFVKSGDYLFDIETGKATFSIESETAGTVLETIGSEGDEILVKSVVCIIGQPGETYQIAGQASVSDAVPDIVQDIEPVSPDVHSAANSTKSNLTDTDSNRLYASPKARATANERGINLLTVTPTGPNGRITRDDVLRTTTTETRYSIVKNSSIRKVIARNMHQSLQSMAQLTLFAHFDASSLITVKDRLNETTTTDEHGRMTINDLIVFAVSRTILGFPYLNAHFNDDTTTLFQDTHIGVAVDTKNGLMVPTIFNANQMSLFQISAAIRTLARECQEGRATPQMLSGGTFSTTNLGAMRIDAFTPIIAPPQTAILGIGGIDYKAKLVDNQIVHYPAIGLSLTFDHRAVDGAPAARFLKALCESLEAYSELIAKG